MKRMEAMLWFIIVWIVGFVLGTILLAIAGEQIVIVNPPIYNQSNNQYYIYKDSSWYTAPSAGGPWIPVPLAAYDYTGQPYKNPPNKWNMHPLPEPRNQNKR